MFQRHVSDQLAALVDGELSAIETTRVNTHLAGCVQCRASLERVRFSASVLEQVAIVQAPPAIWGAIERALETPEARPDADRGFGRGWAPLTWRPAAAVLALAACVLLAFFIRLDRTPARWDVVRLDAPAGETALEIGEWIETGAASRAALRIGEIGTVEVAPNSRLQLVTARSDEHRLNLAYGLISAQILAPPRLFFVNTPSSTVVDLGCAYTMQVDEAGVGHLRVTSGWASLEWEGRESIVPAGASCPTRPDVGPGTPAFDDASDRLKQALLSFDFEGAGTAAIDVVLREARDRDTLTLWHLLSRVDAADRTRIFDRMVELTPLPPGIDRDRALALDRETLTRWREELAWNW